MYALSLDLKKICTLKYDLQKQTLSFNITVADKKNLN